MFIFNLEQSFSYNTLLVSHRMVINLSEAFILNSCLIKKKIQSVINENLIQRKIIEAFAVGNEIIN